MNMRPRVLFLQLPRPDLAVGDPHENVYLAAASLKYALTQSPEAHHWTCLQAPAVTDTLDDAHLTEWIRKRRPDILAVTLFMWNVERTLSLARTLRAANPGIRVVAGGPEVTPDHPILFASPVLDAAVTGEGEGVFPAIMSAMRRGRHPRLPGVAWREDGDFRWGGPPEPVKDLRLVLPPGNSPHNRPDANGTGYVETGRGCPLRCTFCCYNQRRRYPTFLNADEVVSRIAILMRRGATEIRFIDPTLNANPHFDDMLLRLVMLNRHRRVSFFAELRADTLTATQAGWLARANFREIEIGVQSRNPAVLRAVRRPTRLKEIDRGVKLLAGRGIRLTLDIMAGLPGQTLRDVHASLRWASRVPGARVQFLQTLLLPGTELCTTAARLGIAAGPLPPYRVKHTPTLSADELARAETFARRLTGAVPDSPTRRFVARQLPDLFPEMVAVDVSRAATSRIPGRQINRALFLRGDNLSAVHRILRDIVGKAIRDEPHVLWQFVLSPIREEPLDILDALIAEIDTHPQHFLDRMIVPSEGGPRAARRILIQLRPHRRYSRDWVEAAETHLRRAFH
jgi:radical SAM superfamily enzyme YgiQ (UPF0313 family)